jgi:hypothetical protein
MVWRMINSASCRLNCALLVAALWMGHAAIAADAPVNAGYDPPYEVALDANAPPAQWLPQLLKKLLPDGARVLHGPVAVAFGAHTQGWLVALRTAAPDGYALWYFTPQAEAPGRARLIRLRDPQEVDEYMDVVVGAVFNVGPPNSQDLVVLETFSRALPAGGSQQSGGTVYRRVDDGVQAMPEISALLNDVTTAAQARQRLAAPYQQLLPQLPGLLAAQFASLPLRYVQLTALERLQRLQSPHPAFKVYDPANGYLETRGDASLPAYRVAAFKRKDSGWLLAVQQDAPQTQRTWFLRQQDKGWTDVSGQVMPNYAEGTAYKLPREGKRVTAPGAKAWVWTGSNFVSQ